MMRLCLTMETDGNAAAPKTLESWRFVQQMLADLTQTVTEDAIDERELIEGLRVVASVIALCSELTVEADPERPWFFDMCSDTRMIGGPNPDGRLPVGDDPRRPRLPGHRNPRHHRLPRVPGAGRARA